MRICMQEVNKHNTTIRAMGINLIGILFLFCAKLHFCVKHFFDNSLIKKILMLRIVSENDHGAKNKEP